MGRVYTVEFENVNVVAAQDLFEIAPGDDHPVELMAIFVDQFSDVGDAAEELLRYRIIRGQSASGSGGTTPTPVAIDGGDVAASFVAEVNNTNLASGGTPVNVHSGAFNIRSGLALIFPPELMPKASQAHGTIVVRLLAAPVDALSMSGTLYLNEL